MGRGVGGGHGVQVTGWSAGDDGRRPGLLGAGTSALILEAGDLVEDVCEGLVLRPPVQEVVPVIGTRQLLLAVDNAGETNMNYLVWRFCSYGE